MENNKQPLINKIAEPFDKVAKIGRDIRVKNEINEGGNLVYLQKYSYSNVTYLLLMITSVLLLTTITLFILNALLVFQNNSWSTFLGWGIICFLISIPLYFATIYRVNIGKRLKMGSSTKISGTILRIRRVFFPAQIRLTTSQDLGTSNSFPYVILVSWKDVSTGRDYIFRSLLLSNDPSDRFKVGENIDVYLDPKNYQKYYVDTGNLI